MVRIIARCSDMGKREGTLCGRGSYLSRNSSSFSEAMGVLFGPFSFETGDDVLAVVTSGTAGSLPGDGAAS